MLPYILYYCHKMFCPAINSGPEKWLFVQAVVLPVSQM